MSFILFNEKSSFWTVWKDWHFYLLNYWNIYTAVSRTKISSAYLCFLYSVVYSFVLEKLSWFFSPHFFPCMFVIVHLVLIFIEFILQDFHSVILCSIYGDTMCNKIFYFGFWLLMFRFEAKENLKMKEICSEKSYDNIEAWYSHLLSAEIWKALL